VGASSVVELAGQERLFRCLDLKTRHFFFRGVRRIASIPLIACLLVDLEDSEGLAFCIDVIALPASATHRELRQGDGSTKPEYLSLS
jgi:hypothetical protein